MKTALDMPGLKDKKKYARVTERKNCIHCHNIHDAENRQFSLKKPSSLDHLWRYPLPENVGLKIDRDDGTVVQKVIPGTSAEKAGLKAGDKILLMNGQAILSIADMQWVLHHLRKDNGSIEVGFSRNGAKQKKKLQLKPGWRKTDISWRGSMWGLDPKLGFWAVPIEERERVKHQIEEDHKAYKIKWINTGVAAGREVKRAGLRHGDIWVGLNGKPIQQTMKAINTDLRLNHKVGETLQLSILRGGKEQELKVKLVRSD